MAGLKPEISLPVGLATAAVVYGIYQNGLPPVVDIRTAPQNHPDVEGAERAAAWTSAVVVAGISLIAKDPTVFVIGGAMVVALSWWHRHANNVNPEWSLAVPRGADENEVTDLPEDQAANYGYEAA